MTSLKLNDGLDMPQVGLGVWQSDNGQETVDAIHWAFDAGYRHIDTARIYKNEEAVGKGIQSAPQSRGDIWLTTKIWNDDIRQGRTTAALEESLVRLQTDYIDLLLLHWPVEGRIAAWRELEKAIEAGKVRSIGVSNFMASHLRELARETDTAPSVNQIEYHPYLVQNEAISVGEERGTVVTAWSPLMQGKFQDEPAFAEIAEGYGKTAAQVVLRWALQRGVIIIPKSVHEHRIRENIDLFDFELSQEDMQRIDALEKGERFGPDPHNFDF